jgi:hypothetical protein
MRHICLGPSATGRSLQASAAAAAGDCVESCWVVVGSGTLAGEAGKGWRKGGGIAGGGTPVTTARVVTKGLHLRWPAFTGSNHHANHTYAARKLRHTLQMRGWKAGGLHPRRRHLQR